MEFTASDKFFEYRDVNCDMDTSSLGKNLIFLISQPRAGSTLLQRILGSHPEIHTVSEPWLMLYPLFALREHGVRAEFDSNDTREKALHAFLKEISPTNPEAVYYEGVRRMYNYLYEHSMNLSGKHYFLDKTPRYYLIIPELYRTFPEAKYIILLRNPLAAFLSMMKSWSGGNWFWFSTIDRRRDLLDAPNLLSQGRSLLTDDCIVVHYEELVISPECVVKQILDFLGLEYKPNIIKYGDNVLNHWEHGDQGNVYIHDKPVPGNAQSWVQNIQGPQTWRLLYEYLMKLGVEQMDELGYSYEDCRKILEGCKPKIQAHLTISLSFLLKSNTERVFIERRFVRLLKATKLLSRI